MMLEDHAGCSYKWMNGDKEWDAGGLEGSEQVMTLLATSQGGLKSMG